MAQRRDADSINNRQGEADKVSFNLEMELGFDEGSISLKDKHT